LGGFSETGGGYYPCKGGEGARLGGRKKEKKGKEKSQLGSMSGDGQKSGGERKAGKVSITLGKRSGVGYTKGKSSPTPRGSGLEGGGVKNE